MDEFYKTPMGRAFFDGHVPRLVKALEALAKAAPPARPLRNVEAEVVSEVVDRALAALLPVLRAALAVLTEAAAGLPRAQLVAHLEAAIKTIENEVGT